MSTTKIILFYQYSALSEDESLMANLRDAFELLCQRLNLLGRILLGKSRNEGINGTLSGTEDALNAFIVAMLGRHQFQHQPSKVIETIDQDSLESIESFWDSNESFARNAQVSTFTIDSWEDFKWSECHGTLENKHIFPDLYVKVVGELIGTGGVFSSISLSEVNQGYLTPEEFHQLVLQLNNDRADNAVAAEETVLIDCRNHNEHLIGNFLGSLDPNTKTFAQFPKWVQDHKSELDNKKVLMYCTGGIRCEKASAFVRNQTNAKEVYHLRGGIHKYLDRYGSDGLFHGKNFVFDRRGSDAPLPNTSSNSQTRNFIVGKCFYCRCAWDQFTDLCGVCREPMLICPVCHLEIKEYHCKDHEHLKDCYFTNLSIYTSDQLMMQKKELEHHLSKIAIGKKFKQRRKTISRQIQRIDTVITEVEAKHNHHSPSTSTSFFSKRTHRVCKSCGIESCSGKLEECWGFYGRKIQDITN